MSRIYTLGETLLDVIFEKEQPRTARPGGAMLNSSVSLGRLHAPVFLISEYGADKVGDLIHGFLEQNSIGTEYITRFTDGNTALAMAFLDEDRNAEYTFYKAYPPERLTNTPGKFGPGDYLLFGSIYAISPDIRQPVLRILKRADEGGSLRIYDPNFRKAHLEKLADLRPLILRNMQNADVIRGSDEDFRHIFHAESPEEAYRQVRQYCKVLIYTQSTEGVTVFTPDMQERFPVRKLDPLSTIGAGDNFNAGIVFSLFRMGIRKQSIAKLGRNDWEKIVGNGVAFASDVCMSYENYISGQFAGEFAAGE